MSIREDTKVTETKNPNSYKTSLTPKLLLNYIQTDLKQISNHSQTAFKLISDGSERNYSCSKPVHKLLLIYSQTTYKLLRN